MLVPDDSPYFVGWLYSLHPGVFYTVGGLPILNGSCFCHNTTVMWTEGGQFTRPHV